MNRPTRAATAVVVLVALLGACGSNDSSSQGPTTTGAPTTTTTAPTTDTTAYHVDINPADFTTDITHPYFATAMKPGTRRIFDGKRDGIPTHTEVTTTTRTRKVMGVNCIVVEDVVTSNGALVEKTEDWYAQDNDGTVWYFGENTAEYENGAVVSTQGTWEAGVDGAQPGVIMYATPEMGQSYYQEYRPGVAEDRAEILTLDSEVTVPAGTYKSVITTEDSDPLNPDKTDKKWYAPGLGAVHSERIKSGHSEDMSLVKVEQA